MNYWLEDTLERLVRETISKRDIHCVSKALVSSVIIDVTCAGKVFAELVEGASENAVGGVESLFNAVTVMAIDVYVKDTRKGSKKLQNTKDNVVHIAKS